MRIIKFIFRGEICSKYNDIIIANGEGYKQHLKGFIRLNNDAVVSCSIREYKEGFEYCVDCNRGIIYLNNECDRSFSFDVCYKEMMSLIEQEKEIEDYDETCCITHAVYQLYMWEAMGICEVYPLHGRFSYNPYNGTFHPNSSVFTQMCDIVDMQKYRQDHKRKYYKSLHNDLLPISWHPDRVIDWSFDENEKKVLKLLWSTS